MKTLNDLRAYARTRGMSEGRIERLISEVETDENGNVPDYDDIVFGINCEMDNVINNHHCVWFVITFTYSNRSTRIDPLDMVRFANDEEKNVHRCIRKNKGNE